MSTARRARIQYASMAAELGMLSTHARRSYIPDVSGIDFDRQPAVPLEERRALVNAFDAAAELASGGEAVLDFCVEGSGFDVDVRGVRLDGDGVVERGACERVARRVLRVHASHLDLVQLVDAVVEHTKPT
ncbi:hypothetical protein FGB62_2g133 [Gracilaria domingensis]|nr:hypothetical protein FGB62_2g133 [Gracilaria domingensis]